MSIGRYRVVRKLGEGGMGLVFEAEDDALGRRVAVKRLKSGDESSRRRFWREARAGARLSHPSVCQIYEVGEDSQGLFLAMELLAGEPLSQRLELGALSPAEVLSLGAGMLAALSALHAAGIVHRDLKPSNVYLTPHGARILDFGFPLRSVRRQTGVRGPGPSPWAPKADALINLWVDDLRSGHSDRATELLSRLEEGARRAT